VAVIAKDYARIAWQNLINFGILPLEFENPQNYNDIEQGALIEFKNLREDMMNKNQIRVKVKNKNNTIEIFTKHSLSDRQIGLLLKGGVINDFRDKLSS
jgi:aconitate hydratase